MSPFTKIKNHVLSSIAGKEAGDIHAIQEKVLLKKLRNSSNTQIADKYDFGTISSISDYQKRVPIHHYGDMEAYWKLETEGTAKVTLNETIRFFALSTGTTGKKKLIPVSQTLMKDNRKSELHVLSLYLREHPESSLLNKKILGVSGCARMGNTPSNASYGMISGIMAETVSLFVKRSMIPGRKCINISDWNTKLEAIAKETKGRKVGCIFGIPSSVLDVLRKIKEVFSKKEFDYFTKHLEALFFSGVNYRVYRDDIFGIIGRELKIVEYYGASEGILGHQSLTNPDSMEFFYDTIFFEFIPYDDYLRQDYSNRRLLTQLANGESYVVLITSGNGAFSYVLGDLIQCVESSIPRFKIKGRTKLTLNLVTEKTTIDAIERTVDNLSRELNAYPGEFFVTGKVEQNRPRYLWVFEKDATWSKQDRTMLSQKLDQYLVQNNEHYKYFINSILDPSEVQFIDKSRFQKWLSSEKADMGHTKIPRIITDSSIVQRILTSD